MSPADSSVREESILLGRGYPVAARLCSRPCANTAGGTIEKPPQGPCQGCVPRPGHPDGEARVPCRGHARSPIAASRSATLRRCPARASGIATLCYRLLAIDVLIVTSGTWHDLLLKSQQQIIGRRWCASSGSADIGRLRGLRPGDRGPSRHPGRSGSADLSPQPPGRGPPRSPALLRRLPSPTPVSLASRARTRPS